MSGVKVMPVVDGRGIESFIAAARRSQAGNPRWVEPVHDEIRMIFNPRRTPFMRENAIQPFVAWRGDEPVGRIVATIDRRHIAKFNDSCGFFGFIEAIDDRAVFSALFEEAEGFLISRGMKTARGPFSLTINHESGLRFMGLTNRTLSGPTMRRPITGGISSRSATPRRWTCSPMSAAWMKPAIPSASPRSPAGEAPRR
jgi:hypothetical protein